MKALIIIQTQKRIMAITNKSKRIRISRDMVGRFSEDDCARSKIKYGCGMQKEMVKNGLRIGSQTDSIAKRIVAQL